MQPSKREWKAQLCLMEIASSLSIYSPTNMCVLAQPTHLTPKTQNSGSVIAKISQILKVLTIPLIHTNGNCNLGSLGISPEKG